MRKIWIAFIVALCMASCVSTQTAGRRAGERREVQQRVYDDINSRRFTIHFDYVLPHSMPARYLTTTYSLSVNGDSIGLPLEVSRRHAESADFSGSCYGLFYFTI